MEKTLIALTGLMLVVTVLLVGDLVLITSASEEIPYDYSYTTAICDGRACADFLVTCKDKNLIEMKQILGKIIFREGWKDPRENRNTEFCG